MVNGMTIRRRYPVALYNLHQNANSDKKGTLFCFTPDDVKSIVFLNQHP